MNLSDSGGFWSDSFAFRTQKPETTWLIFHYSAPTKLMITNKVVLREGDRRIRILLFHLNFLQTHLIFALNPCPDEAQYFGINRKIR